MPPRTTTTVAPAKPKWTEAELMAVKGFGPALIGEEMHAAAQALIEKTGNGVFGPALLGELPESYKDHSKKAETVEK